MRENEPERWARGLLESDLLSQVTLQDTDAFHSPMAVGPCGRGNSQCTFDGATLEGRQEHLFSLTSCSASAEECSEIVHSHVTSGHAES